MKKLMEQETRCQEIPEQLMYGHLYRFSLNMFLRSACFTDKALFLVGKQKLLVFGLISSSAGLSGYQITGRQINPLTPNDHYRGRTAPLTSKRCILYIHSTNIGTEYFKHSKYSPFFHFKIDRKSVV